MRDSGSVQRSSRRAHAPSPLESSASAPLVYQGTSRALKRVQPQRRALRAAAILSGALSLMMSSMCALGALLNLASSFQADMMIMLVFALGVCGLGAASMSLGLRQRADAQLSMDALTQRALLALAQEHEGLLTPAWLAMQTDLTLVEAEQALRELVHQHVAELHLSPQGELLYVFPSLRPALALSLEDQDHARFDHALAQGGTSPASQATFDFDGDLDRVSVSQDPMARRAKPQ